MDMVEYSKCDGVVLADLVKMGEVSPKELAYFFVEAVEKVNPKINAVIEVYFDRIEALDDQTISDGPFAGVPFLMKDIGAGEKGRYQESGSRLMKGHVAEQDSFLTELFKKAGLTLLGRTTTPEFALGISTESELVGVTYNPWDLDVMGGGSSGGAAASVAAGIVPIAHGSDNGGSIRIPASACGLIGLKPSRGRVTLGPDIGELWPGMLQEFVLSRTVRDTAFMLDAVSKPVLGDPFIIKRPVRPYAHELDAPRKKLKIAWTIDPWQGESSVDSEIVRCMEQVVSECENAGHEMVQDSPVFDYEEYLHAVCIAWAFGMYMGLDMAATSMGRKISEETVEPVMLSFYEYSKELTAADMFMAEFILNQFRRNFGKFFEEYDMLLTPTLNQLPEPHGKYSKMRTDVGYLDYMRLCEETKVHTTAANVTGQPAITLPLGQSRSNLPVGIQFMARFGEEGALIRLSSSLEKEMPWHDRIPPVHVSR
ncbi:amidase [Methanobacterium ferruginis]|uniref:amidase n=1 Tax=Methanobacterium ferruginis TaxID=710191 RepID=UPI0025745B28|nr:amidase [Methanobacterium ferruginis]BDZ68255.1 amidase [Methanobacterium ferruginis]